MPLPPEGLEWIERAWHELSGSRHSPELGIPISEIVLWLDENGIIDPEDRRIVRQIIEAMDAEFRNWADTETKLRDEERKRNAKRQSQRRQ